MSVKFLKGVFISLTSFVHMLNFVIIRGVAVSFWSLGSKKTPKPLNLSQMMDLSGNQRSPHLGGKKALQRAKSEKHCQLVSNADRKVFANPESFCDMFIIS